MNWFFNIRLPGSNRTTPNTKDKLVKTNIQEKCNQILSQVLNNNTDKETDQSLTNIIQNLSNLGGLGQQDKIAVARTAQIVQKYIKQNASSPPIYENFVQSATELYQESLIASDVRKTDFLIQHIDSSNKLDESKKTKIICILSKFGEKTDEELNFLDEHKDIFLPLDNISLYTEKDLNTINLSETLIGKLLSNDGNMAEIKPMANLSFMELSTLFLIDKCLNEGLYEDADAIIRNMEEEGLSAADIQFKEKPLKDYCLTAMDRLYLSEIKKLLEPNKDTTKKQTPPKEPISEPLKRVSSEAVFHLEKERLKRLMVSSPARQIAIENTEQTTEDTSYYGLYDLVDPLVKKLSSEKPITQDEFQNKIKTLSLTPEETLLLQLMQSFPEFKDKACLTNDTLEKHIIRMLCYYFAYKNNREGADLLVAKEGVQFDIKQDSIDENIRIIGDDFKNAIEAIDKHFSKKTEFKDPLIDHPIQDLSIQQEPEKRDSFAASHLRRTLFEENETESVNGLAHDPQEKSVITQVIPSSFSEPIPPSFQNIVSDAERCNNDLTSLSPLLGRIDRELGETHQLLPPDKLAIFQAITTIEKKANNISNEEHKAAIKQKIDSFKDRHKDSIFENKDVLKEIEDINISKIMQNQEQSDLLCEQEKILGDVRSFFHSFAEKKMSEFLDRFHKRMQGLLKTPGNRASLVNDPMITLTQAEDIVKRITMLGISQLQDNTITKHSKDATSLTSNPIKESQQTSIPKVLFITDIQKIFLAYAKGEKNIYHALSTAVKILKNRSYNSLKTSEKYILAYIAEKVANELSRKEFSENATEFVQNNLKDLQTLRGNNTPPDFESIKAALDYIFFLPEAKTSNLQVEPKQLSKEDKIHLLSSILSVEDDKARLDQNSRDLTKVFPFSGNLSNMEQIHSLKEILQLSIIDNLMQKGHFIKAIEKIAKLPEHLQSVRFGDIELKQYTTYENTLYLSLIEEQTNLAKIEETKLRQIDKKIKDAKPEEKAKLEEKKELLKQKKHTYDNTINSLVCLMPSKEMFSTIKKLVQTIAKINIPSQAPNNPLNKEFFTKREEFFKWIDQNFTTKETISPDEFASLGLDPYFADDEPETLPITWSLPLLPDSKITKKMAKDALESAYVQGLKTLCPSLSHALRCRLPDPIAERCRDIFSLLAMPIATIEKHLLAQLENLTTLANTENNLSEQAKVNLVYTIESVELLLRKIPIKQESLLRKEIQDIKKYQGAIFADAEINRAAKITHIYISAIEKQPTKKISHEDKQRCYNLFLKYNMSSEEKKWLQPHLDQLPSILSIPSSPSLSIDDRNLLFVIQEFLLTGLEKEAIYFINKLNTELQNKVLFKGKPLSTSITPQTIERRSIVEEEGIPMLSIPLASLKEQKPLTFNELRSTILTNITRKPDLPVFTESISQIETYLKEKSATELTDVERSTLENSLNTINFHLATLEKKDTEDLTQKIDLIEKKLKAELDPNKLCPDIINAESIQALADHLKENNIVDALQLTEIERRLLKETRVKIKELLTNSNIEDNTPQSLQQQVKEIENKTSIFSYINHLRHDITSKKTMDESCLPLFQKLQTALATLSSEELKNLSTTEKVYIKATTKHIEHLIDKSKGENLENGKSILKAIYALGSEAIFENETFNNYVKKYSLATKQIEFFTHEIDPKDKKKLLTLLTRSSWSTSMLEELHISKRVLDKLTAIFPLSPDMTIDHQHPPGDSLHLKMFMIENLLKDGYYEAARNLIVTGIGEDMCKKIKFRGKSLLEWLHEDDRKTLDNIHTIANTIAKLKDDPSKIEDLKKLLASLSPEEVFLDTKNKLQSNVNPPYLKDGVKDVCSTLQNIQTACHQISVKARANVLTESDVDRLLKSLQQVGDVAFLPTKLKSAIHQAVTAVEGIEPRSKLLQNRLDKITAYKTAYYNELIEKSASLTKAMIEHVKNLPNSKISPKEKDTLENLLYKQELTELESRVFLSLASKCTTNITTKKGLFFTEQLHLTPNDAYNLLLIDTLLDQHKVDQHKETQSSDIATLVSLLDKSISEKALYKGKPLSALADKNTKISAIKKAPSAIATFTALHDLSKEEALIIRCHLLKNDPKLSNEIEQIKIEEKIIEKECKKVLTSNTPPSEALLSKIKLSKDILSAFSPAVKSLIVCLINSLDSGDIQNIKDSLLQDARVKRIVTCMNIAISYIDRTSMTEKERVKGLIYKGYLSPEEDIEFADDFADKFELKKITVSLKETSTDELEQRTNKQIKYQLFFIEKLLDQKDFSTARYYIDTLPEDVRSAATYKKCPLNYAENLIRIEDLLKNGQYAEASDHIKLLPKEIQESVELNGFSLGAYIATKEDDNLFGSMRTVIQALFKEPLENATIDKGARIIKTAAANACVKNKYFIAYLAQEAMDSDHKENLGLKSICEAGTMLENTYPSIKSVMNQYRKYKEEITNVPNPLITADFNYRVFRLLSDLEVTEKGLENLHKNISLFSSKNIQIGKPSTSDRAYLTASIRLYLIENFLKSGNYEEANRIIQQFSIEDQASMKIYGKSLSDLSSLKAPTTKRLTPDEIYTPPVIAQEESGKEQSKAAMSDRASDFNPKEEPTHTLQQEDLSTIDKEAAERITGKHDPVDIPVLSTDTNQLNIVIDPKVLDEIKDLLFEAISLTSTDEINLSETFIGKLLSSGEEVVEMKPKTPFEKKLEEANTLAQKHGFLCYEGLIRGEKDFKPDPYTDKIIKNIADILQRKEFSYEPKDKITDTNSTEADYYHKTDTNSAQASYYLGEARLESENLSDKTVKKFIQSIIASINESTKIDPSYRGTPRLSFADRVLANKKMRYILIHEGSELANELARNLGFQCYEGFIRNDPGFLKSIATTDQCIAAIVAKSKEKQKPIQSNRKMPDLDTLQNQKDIEESIETRYQLEDLNSDDNEITQELEAIGLTSADAIDSSNTPIDETLSTKKEVAEVKPIGELDTKAPDSEPLVEHENIYPDENLTEGGDYFSEIFPKGSILPEPVKQFLLPAILQERTRFNESGKLKLAPAIKNFIALTNSLLNLINLKYKRTLVDILSKKFITETEFDFLKQFQELITKKLEKQEEELKNDKTFVKEKKIAINQLKRTISHIEKICENIVNKTEGFPHVRSSIEINANYFIKSCITDINRKPGAKETSIDSKTITHKDKTKLTSILSKSSITELEFNFLKQFGNIFKYLAKICDKISRGIPGFPKIVENTTSEEKK
jgi:hypothetical protein